MAVSLSMTHTAWSHTMIMLLPRQVVTDGRSYGLAYLEKLIRDVERSPVGDSHARFKRSGDVAVAAILLSPEVS